MLDYDKKKNREFRPEGPVIEEYSRLALDYDRRWSFYVSETNRVTRSYLDVQPGARVLDVGCGTGAMLELLQADLPAASLSGVDPVGEMLGVAASRLPDGVDLRCGGAEDLPFDNHQFDVLVSCNAFHYVTDPDRALAEMQRVLRPGAQLVVTDWCDDFLSCRLCDWYLTHFNRAHKRTYRSGELTALADRAGFSGASTQTWKLNWLWGLMTLEGRSAG